ncbi:serine/threonine-protein phosphatase 7 [Hordeum vulgare]|nr:serine/threonine-protein phosphatase 7 [Hordeum vulgare]
MARPSRARLSSWPSATQAPPTWAKPMELTPLKIRSHGASSVMQYDERYTPYIKMTELLPFVQLVSRSTPNLNAAAVTTLIDRWRPETHSFHLRTGDMTVTLQDVSMITALPIEGKPLCMSTDSEGWRQQMEALIGMSPQEPEASTRVEICPPAYEEDILEEPTEYDALAQGRYNKLIREGYQTSFAPVLNFVRKEVKKQADESEDILDNTARGKKGESALRLFIKEQGQKLRRLSNILGCRDPEYVSPSRSGSSERNTLDDSASSGARMDDGDITSAANTQRNTVEDDVDTPEVADEMTLKVFQCSAYMLKPRKEFRRYSPDDYAKGKNPVAGGSRLSTMRSMDDEDEDDDDDESDDPEQFVVARRKKLVSKRGRGPKV